MNIKKMVIPIFFAASVFIVQAQENWGLDQCIKHALENNMQIKQQSLNVLYSNNLATLSKAAVLPSLNAGASHNFNFGRAIDPYTNEFISTNVQSNNAYVSARMNLFTGLQQYNNIRKTSFDLLAGQSDLEKTKNDVSMLIATAYLQILFSEELLQISQARLTVTESQILRTEKLVTAGSLPEGNLLEVQSQAAQETLQVINAQNQLNSSKLTLKQILDIKSNVDFQIIRPDFSAYVMTSQLLSVEEIYSAAAGMPQIKSAEYKLQSAERSVAIAYAGASPKLSLSANLSSGYSDARKQYSIGNATFIPIGFVEGTTTKVLSPSVERIEEPYSFVDQYTDNASSSIGISLSIPIFNNLQIGKNISNSKISLQNSRLQLEQTKNQLYKDIQQAHADAQAAFAKFEGSTKAFNAMQLSFKYTQQKFDLGLLTSVDYNLAKNQLANTESQLLQAKYEYIFKKSILDFYSGKELRF